MNTRAERRRENQEDNELNVFVNTEGKLIRGVSKWKKLISKSKAGIEYTKNIRVIENMHINP